MLHHITATVICREIADVIVTVLLFPTFMASSSAFRHHFLHLLRLDTAPISSATSATPSRFVRHFVALGRRICGFPSSPPSPLPPSATLSQSEPPLRWSWGKGWRQSFSPPFCSPSGTTPPPPVAANLTEADPEQLDTIVDQHNSAAYNSGSAPYAIEGAQFRHYTRHHGSIFAPKRSTAYTRHPRHL